MATIVNNPPAQTVDNGSAGGWAVALIVIIALLLVGLFTFGRIHTGTMPSTTNVNVSLPGGSSGTSGSASAGASTGGTGGGTSGSTGGGTSGSSGSSY